MAGLTFTSLSACVPDYYAQKNRAEAKAGRKLSTKEFEENYLVVKESHSITSTGTSVFDPALCELMYKWYTKKGDKVIDPFAGGSVRGIVAAELGRKYTGVDLRQEQIEANYANAEICSGDKPVWICGDSANIKSLAKGSYDFIMTCPPYGNLEVYSDNPDDLSNMPDEDFDAKYQEILKNTVSMLENDRFACVVVGNYRDKNGNLRDLVGITVRAMESAGAHYYNDIIIVTPLGGLATRVGRSFRKSRKVGRTHQYCLIFVKGDGKKAAQRLGDVEILIEEELLNGT